MHWTKGIYVYIMTRNSEPLKEYFYYVKRGFLFLITFGKVIIPKWNNKNGGGY